MPGGCGGRSHAGRRERMLRPRNAGAERYDGVRPSSTAPTYRSLPWPACDGCTPARAKALARKAGFESFRHERGLKGAQYRNNVYVLQ